MYPGTSGATICVSGDCDGEADWAGLDVVSSEWTSYTPTFTAFGTVSSVSFYWRRIGDSIQIQGRFTSGTPSASEGRISLPSGLTAASSQKLGTIQVVGTLASSSTTVRFHAALAESNVSYLTYGYDYGTQGALEKREGDDGAANGTVFSLFAELPIAGWEATRDTG